MLIIPVEKKTSVGKIKSSTNDKESCITVRIHTKEAKKLNIVRWRSQTTIPKLYSLQMLPNKRSSNSETMIQFIFIGSSKMGSSILEIVPISVQHKSKKVEARGGSGMQRRQPRWWCCRSRLQRRHRGHGGGGGS